MEKMKHPLLSTFVQNASSSAAAAAAGSYNLMRSNFIDSLAKKVIDHRNEGEKRRTDHPVSTVATSNMNRKELIEYLYRSVPGFASLLRMNTRAYQISLVRDAVWHLAEKTFL